MLCLHLRRCARISEGTYIWDHEEVTGKDCEEKDLFTFHKSED